ncbi:MULTISPECIES: DUF2695 domain-containing protein [unclassified Brevibacterium]|uniref:DUF2695 domain-containing protein n=1 Tax=unclassified Brevibacterium TaxID=2614124 RepID=UPI001E2CA240|nr:MULTISPECIES: DUF2695 domain-containing protein [unclassified Brevibacterium]MCD1284508.1 hypothetical protein [Brevibacterium sp. CCUG 69071]MDK8435874.1 DUF2695 domain-containing protein [Brevibacterium sp. H-BE7]
MDKKIMQPEFETIIDEASARILTPRAGECLACYVFRQLGEFGCNGTHRFAVTFRDRTAPRATALLERLGSMGACCCDCELFNNAYWLAPKPWFTGYWFGEMLGTRFESAEPIDLRKAFGINEPSAKTIYLCCRSVRRGSTQPCSNWARLPRR